MAVAPPLSLSSPFAVGGGSDTKPYINPISGQGGTHRPTSTSGGEMWERTCGDGVKRGTWTSGWEGLQVPPSFRMYWSLLDPCCVLQIVNAMLVPIKEIS